MFQLILNQCDDVNNVSLSSIPCYGTIILHFSQILDVLKIYIIKKLANVIKACFLIDRLDVLSIFRFTKKNQAGSRESFRMCPFPQHSFPYY